AISCRIALYGSAPCADWTKQSTPEVAARSLIARAIRRWTAALWQRKEFSSSVWVFYSLDETNLEARKTGNNLVGFPDWSYSAIAVAHQPASSQQFAGACDVLAEDSLMTKRALSAVTGFLCLCLLLSAQLTDRPDIFSALNNSLPRLPSLALSD